MRDLATDIEEARSKPFEWGVHDCVTFADGACLVQTGKGFAADWVGKYSTALEARRFFARRMRAGGYTDCIHAMDKRLIRGLGFPKQGSIIAREAEKQCTGFTLGVAISTKAAFVGDSGLVFDRIVPTDIWWYV